MVIAAAVLGLLAVTHERARPPGGDVVLAAAQLPQAPRPAPLPDLPPPAVPPPPAATTAPSGSAEQASVVPPGSAKRSPPSPPPGRRRARVAPSEATPSAYRLPPLGL